MNLKRFTGRTSRDAMQKVKLNFGSDAIVLSTKPCPEGIEIIAMASDAMVGIEKHVPPAPVEATEPEAAPAWAPSAFHAVAGDEQHQPLPASVKLPGTAPAADPITSVQDDVRRLAMSTLSFQDYVRERMLKRRHQALKERELTKPAAAKAQHAASAAQRTEPSFAMQPPVGQAAAQKPMPAVSSAASPSAQAASTAVPAAAATILAAQQRLRESVQTGAAPAPAPAVNASPSVETKPTPSPAVTAGDESLRIKHLVAEPPPAAALWPRPGPTAPTASPMSVEMMHELREMKDLIEERFGAIAFMQRLQRSPAQATVSQKLLECGFSPALVRKMIDGMPADIKDGSSDPIVWATRVLERNLVAAEKEAAIEDQGGVFAMIGSTGTGKTTSTAKIAAAFAAKHGANHLGLVTLDAYRVGAHEQLRTYGRILGVPVHTAHDRAALEDLLDLLSAKKLVLIDTAGIAQRDARTKELLEMISHRSINRLLVINAASQGETIEDVMAAYRASTAKGVVISKLDEAVKLAPALDALIRHRLPVVGVANGQRVPEDWHRLSSASLIHRALRASPSAAYRLDTEDLNLIFALSSSASNEAARADAA